VPSGRGLVVLVSGLAMWAVARLIGSPALAAVGVGLVALPFAAAAFVGWGRQRLSARRHLSDVRVAPGTRVSVDVEVDNRSFAPTSFLLVEDRLPSALGRSARLVLSGLPGRGAQRAQYTLVPQVRGRYTLGPLSIDVSDPFALTRVRLQFDQREELFVTPEIEDLGGPTDPTYGANIGVSRAKQLFRSGEEFYTMRQYQEGDDLRRIHWPSVARTNELMIRQDETSRRSSSVVFIDTRSAMLGQTHGQAFEKAVSCAASVGLLLAREGFSLKLSTTESPPASVTEQTFLDALTAVSHSSSRSVGPALAWLRGGAAGDTTLVYISAPPPPTELASIVRTGAAFGPKLAILVYPLDPATLSSERQSQLEGRASQAQHSLSRSGWRVIVLSPTARLKDRWNREPSARRLVVNG